MKISNSALSAVVVSVLGLAATLNAPQALAVDGKNYPASMCVKWSGTGTTFLSWSSMGNNSSSGWVYLDCPAVKDARNIYSGWVRATDRHYSSDISCGLYSTYRRTSDSAVFYWSPGTKATTGSGNHVQHLSYGGASADPYGHYYYSCSIPPTYGGNASQIHTYNVTENE